MLFECYIIVQEWDGKASLNVSIKFEYYRKFVMSSHNLEVVLRRYNRIIRENHVFRVCKMCNQNAIESEYHVFFLCCFKYSGTCICNEYIGQVS